MKVVRHQFIVVIRVPEVRYCAVLYSSALVALTHTQYHLYWHYLRRVAQVVVVVYCLKY